MNNLEGTKRKMCQVLSCYARHKCNYCANREMTEKDYEEPLVDMNILPQLSAVIEVYADKEEDKRTKEGVEEKQKQKQKKKKTKKKKKKKDSKMMLP